MASENHDDPQKYLEVMILGIRKTEPNGGLLGTLWLSLSILMRKQSRIGIELCSLTYK